MWGAMPGIKQFEELRAQHQFCPITANLPVSSWGHGMHRKRDAR
jgi:hypothetical protein